MARGIPSRTNSDEPVRRASRRLSEVPTTLASRATSQTSSSNEADLPEGSEAPGPGSPVSTRAPPGGGLQVKKTRNPVAPRKEPAPRAPRGTKKVAPPTTSRPPTAAQRIHPSTKPQARAGPSSATGDDIDSITTGMKKIRINLITQSQKEARERARLEAEKVKARSVSASAAISQPKPARPIEAPADRRQSPEIRGPDSGNISPTQVAAPNSEIPTPPATISSSGLTTPFPDAPFEINEPQQVSLPPSSSPIPSVSIQSSDDDNVFIAYQPEGPAPVAVAQQEPIKWLPPNVQTPSSQTPAATPSPVKKSNLFQYTEGIPFAPRPQQHAGEQKPTDEGAKSEPPQH